MPAAVSDLVVPEKISLPNSPARKGKLSIRGDLLPNSALYAEIQGSEYVCLPVKDFGGWYEDILDAALMGALEKDLDGKVIPAEERLRNAVPFEEVLRNAEPDSLESKPFNEDRPAEPDPGGQLRIREELLPDSALYAEIQGGEYVCLPVADFGDWYADARDGEIAEKAVKNESIPPTPFADFCRPTGKA
jgi:hypothetical protein